jgi:catalase
MKSAEPMTAFRERDSSACIPGLGYPVSEAVKDEALVIAPVSGVLKAGRRTVTVDRTVATARSIEFDALVVGGGTTPTSDIKLVVLLQEAFRHRQAIAAWGDGGAVLKSARISSRDPGVEVAEEVDKAFTANLAAALGLHRVWGRAAKVMSSAVPPAA